ncbi:CHAT domain-containing tetratricopeptide repeat protein [Pyxidicoccus trucidator]|uniref:CHAT domain-containing tetratricopeptide repeat protein n=1 Tax=Pyxidicoccus trucidator TaxID=2709662 RepID=UPI001F080FC1|nr:CHAT domain-containing tetratricopeptide repeat protein [Pyxidicoccus trucidator]
MRSVLGWTMVVVLCCAPRVAAAEEATDARLLEAKTAFDEAAKLRKADQIAEAILQSERALTLREAALGASHPEVATSLNQLGGLYRRKRDMSRVEPLLQRALAIREAALGQNHLDVADSLTSLAWLYSSQELHARAEPLFERALAIREALLGQNHPDVAAALDHLASLYAFQGLHARAEPLFERALAIREALPGQNHSSIAASLTSLALVYSSRGQRARARPLYERALAIQEASLGKNHPDVAAALDHLASFYNFQGLHARAEPLYERALAIQEATLGKNHPDVVDSLTNLARAYFFQGLHARAEPLFERALAIQEATLGKNHPDVADSLNNLSSLYINQRLLARAKPLIERTLIIWEALGKHSSVAASLDSLARIYINEGLHTRAEQLMKRALAIREATLGKDHPDVADSLISLAGLYDAQGLSARAVALQERALAICEADHGKNDISTANSSTNLASLYFHQGAYARAETLEKRAISIWESSPNRYYPLGIDSLYSSLARSQLAQHRLDEAVPLLTHAFALSEERLRQESLDFSESRLERFLRRLRYDEEYIYAIARAHPDNVGVQRLALSSVLLRKGRSVEQIADTSRTVYRSLGPQDRDTFERLRGLRTQLAQLSLKGPGSLTPADYQQRMKILADQGDALEADLARRSAPLRALTTLPSPSEIVERVAATLPPDGALIEFIAYADRPLVQSRLVRLPQHPSQLRYLALILFPDSSIRILDLGPADRIDRAASKLRNALARRDADYHRPAQDLYDLAFRPLLPLLGDARRIFLAPDGQLGLIPFDTLHDGERFLTEAFDFSYLTSGKDLLPRPQGLSSAQSVVVFADPAFEARLDTTSSTTSNTPSDVQRSPAVERFFSTLRKRWAGEPWTPLPGTRQEAAAIQRLLPQAQLFLGAEATKQRLLQLITPGILHIAAHGFFLDDAAATPDARAVGHFGGQGRGTPASVPADPLLRSGLVLAGAQAPTTSDSGTSNTQAENSMVTALEFAGLNLWGTQLVVLSACDTGRGDVRLGQGVYGLRRAFIIAGAETVVMSLWKVNDDITRLLMEDYYRHLLAGQGRAEALRDAMRTLRQTHPHPYYWAPFIALGRDAPLQSLTPAPAEQPGQ